MPNPREESFARTSYPDISMITPQLYVGAHPPPGMLDAVHDYAGISVIVSVAKEAPVLAEHHPGRVVFHSPLEDAGPPSQREYRLAVIAAQFVADRIARDEQVLVCCLAGINRSAWIAGWALKRTMVRPRTGAAAVELLRKQRSSLVLSNSYFEALVTSDEHPQV